MSGRSNPAEVVAQTRQLMEEAAEKAIKRAQVAGQKPSLRRYTWSRFHADLLDDNRWSLIAYRTRAPLPLVEALLVRLEVHANKSVPRGYVGDFSIEGMAARWSVDAELVAQIYAQLEQPDIGWIDQDHVVSFWDRNPDKVDETAALRQQRVRDRKKGMKVLANLARQGLITEQLRLEREIALRESKEPSNVIASWPELAASRRDSVTVTTRADHIIKQDAAGTSKNGLAKSERSDGVGPYPAGEIRNFGEAQLWLRTEGERSLTSRLGVMRTKASQLLERWSAGMGGDLVGLVAIVTGALGSPAGGEALERMVEQAIGRRNAEREGPSLPLPPVAVSRK